MTIGYPNVIIGISKGGVVISDNTKNKVDSKTNQYRIRLSDDELKILDYCAKKKGLTKADIIRQGINYIYDSIKEK